MVYSRYKNENKNTSILPEHMFLL